MKQFTIRSQMTRVKQHAGVTAPRCLTSCPLLVSTLAYMEIHHVRTYSFISDIQVTAAFSSQHRSRNQPWRGVRVLGFLPALDSVVCMSVVGPVSLVKWRKKSIFLSLHPWQLQLVFPSHVSPLLLPPRPSTTNRNIKWKLMHSKLYVLV